MLNLIVTLLIFQIFQGKILRINAAEGTRCHVLGRTHPDPVTTVGSMVFLDTTFFLVVMCIPGCFADNLTATLLALAPMASHRLWVAGGEDVILRRFHEEE